MPGCLVALHLEKLKKLHAQKEIDFGDERREYDERHARISEKMEKVKRNNARSQSQLAAKDAEVKKAQEELKEVNQQREAAELELSELKKSLYEHRAQIVKEEQENYRILENDKNVEVVNARNEAAKQNFRNRD